MSLRFLVAVPPLYVPKSGGGGLFTAIFLITCSVYVVSKITISYVDGNRMFCKKVMFDIKSGLKDNLNYNVWQSLIFRGQKCNKSAAFLNWKNRMFGFPLLYG